MKAREQTYENLMPDITFHESSHELANHTLLTVVAHSNSITANFE